MAKQRPCPSNTGRWFRQCLVIYRCLDKWGGGVLVHTPMPQTGLLMLRLPPELWDGIADAAHSDALSQVCRSLRRRLGSRRYVQLVCEASRAAEHVAAVVGNVRALQLAVCGLWDPTEAVAALRRAPHLHTVALENLEADMGVAGARAVAALKDLPVLQALTIDLSGNAVGTMGAEALAGLKVSSGARPPPLPLCPAPFRGVFVTGQEGNQE